LRKVFEIGPKLNWSKNKIGPNMKLVQFLNQSISRIGPKLKIVPFKNGPN